MIKNLSCGWSGEWSELVHEEWVGDCCPKCGEPYPDGTGSDLDRLEIEETDGPIRRDKSLSIQADLHSRRPSSGRRLTKNMKHRRARRAAKIDPENVSASNGYRGWAS